MLRRAELVRRLTELAPRNRIDAMMEEVDGKALVRSLPAEDVYSTIIDVGLPDSTEIVQLATPEQFRTFVDLAAWQRDRMDPLEVLHWLRAARGDDDEDFVKKLGSLDMEVLELVYKRLVIIHDLEENPDVDTEGPTMEMPEGKYLLEFRIDGVDEAALRRLTYDLVTQNPFELGRFLEAVRWEAVTELEEAAYQFRRARLEDLGFPPLDESIKVFAWVDPEKVGVKGRAQSALAQQQNRVDYVAAAFQGLDPVERQNLEGEVRYLVNCVLVADGAEPGDPLAIKRLSEHARDYLDLGLEHYTGGDPALATDVVRETTLRMLFQCGFSLTLRLKRQVEKLVHEEGSRFGETWLALEEESEALGALLQRRPLKALKVPGAEPVPFRSRREVAESEAILQRVRQQRAVFQSLLSPSPAEIIARFGSTLAELTPQRLFAAVVARAEVDELVDVAPFPELKLTELCSRIFEEAGPGAQLRASAGKRALATLQSKLSLAGPELETMVQRVLTTFLADFGAAWVKDGRVAREKIVALPITGQLLT
ncbi:MAG: DUF6178 family protein [Archangium sp.]|nr:DUF6178 family protein [Archangium sp.]